jgi:hypothetical protein
MELIKVNLIPFGVIILKLINVLEGHAENVSNVKKKLLGQSSNQWTATIIKSEHIGNDKRESFNAISSRTNHSDGRQSGEFTKNLTALVLSRSVVVLTFSFLFLFKICTV